MSDYLPEEVLIEIFLRLPAKWVMNSRTNDRIMVRHYERSLLKDIVKLHRDDDGSFIPDEELILPLDARRSPYAIIDSSFGLVCLYGFVFRTRPKHIVIWNPSLGFSKRILVKPFDEDHFEEPIYGFGFDPKSNDHKVVRILYHQQRRYVGEGVVKSVEIYALNVGEWVDISGKAAPGCLIKDSLSRAYVDGAVYWVAQMNVGVISRKLVLSLFDLSDETFKTLEMPDELKWKTKLVEQKFQNEQLKVVAMNKSLSLVHFFIQWTKSPSFDGCNIWMLVENGGARGYWTIKYRVDLRLGIANVLGLRKNGEVVLVARHTYELICFPIGSRKIRYLDMIGDWSTFYMNTYIESLRLYERGNHEFINNFDSSAVPATGNGDELTEA
ncbi:F-box/kelch-repeat protein At3g06240-like [Mangifera indica]|uniref:F-box/kelch-repeat protein At3g06240-like n=1 Tax=Mangifera indica TaxID=29780 RepID=UPI001CFBFF28|nr:F-box/kelch-repeat protein At3g06240-like [Mangifera indica]